MPILNDEYKVYVFIGDKVKANKAIQKYIGEKGEFIEEANMWKYVMIDLQKQIIKNLK